MNQIHNTFTLKNKYLSQINQNSIFSQVYQIVQEIFIKHLTYKKSDSTICHYNNFKAINNMYPILENPNNLFGYIFCSVNIKISLNISLFPFQYM